LFFDPLEELVIILEVAIRPEHEVFIKTLNACVSERRSYVITTFRNRA